MNRLNVLSIPVSTGSYTEFVEGLINAARNGQSQYTCVANVHMLVEAYKDRQFARTVKDATYITPDGKPLVWALRMLHGLKQERVAGMDLLPDLLEAAAINQLPVFFYGGTTELMKKTELYVAKNFPHVKIAGVYSPPFRNLTALEEEEIANNINRSGAALVFVVLGCPKQEKWMAAMKGKIDAVMIGVGGALPVMIGEQRRAPRWMQRYGLEWVYRLAQEPGRLFKRYAVTNSVFIYLLLKAYLQKLFPQRVA